MSKHIPRKNAPTKTERDRYWHGLEIVAKKLRNQIDQMQQQDIMFHEHDFDDHQYNIDALTRSLHTIEAQLEQEEMFQQKKRQP